MTAIYQPRIRIMLSDSGLKENFRNMPDCLLNLRDRKSTRLNSSHVKNSYAVFFMNATPYYVLYPLSLHDALPISELKQRVRQDYPWNFILEGEYGTIKLRKSYDSHLSATDPYYALGLRIEREFSEYARLFIKPT